MMNTEAAVKFVAGFDVAALIAANEDTSVDGSAEQAFLEAKNLVTLAIKNPGLGVVPTLRGDRHTLFENESFLNGLRSHGILLQHVPGVVGDFSKTVDLYRKEFGEELTAPAGCLVKAAGCLLEASSTRVAGCLVQASATEAAGCLLEAVSST